MLNFKHLVPNNNTEVWPAKLSMSEAGCVTPLSSSLAILSDESRGSSVSTQLREEYEDLLRYAVVTPVVDAKVPFMKRQSGVEDGGSSTSQRAFFPAVHHTVVLASPRRKVEGETCSCPWCNDQLAQPTLYRSPRWLVRRLHCLYL